MLNNLDEWKKLEGTNTASLLLTLVDDDEKLQKAANEALDYSLLNVGADRPENYGDPKILLENDLILQVIPILIHIISEDTFNSLSKYCALGLLWDMYNFALTDEAKEVSLEKTETIRQLINSSEFVVNNTRYSQDQDIHTRAQMLLELIKNDK